MHYPKLKCFIKAAGRTGLVALGGIAGGAIAYVVVFYGTVLFCRVVVWMTGNSNYMNLMWSLVCTEPIALVVGCSLGIAIVPAMLLQRITRRDA